MEHMILWAICSLMALLTMIGMGSTKPEKNAQELDLGNFASEDTKRFLGLIFGSIFLGIPFWGFFELVYWVFT